MFKTRVVMYVDGFFDSMLRMMHGDDKIENQCSVYYEWLPVADLSPLYRVRCLTEYAKFEKAYEQTHKKRKWSKN